LHVFVEPVLLQVEDTEDFIVYKLPKALRPPTPDEPAPDATVSVGRHTLTKVGWGATCFGVWGLEGWGSV
jgi:hypothetical protein